jgi:hypothetical protein
LKGIKKRIRRNKELTSLYFLTSTIMSIGLGNKAPSLNRREGTNDVNWINFVY